MSRIFTEKVRRFCLDHSLFLPNERILVALSGGADSMVLLHILSQLVGRSNLVAMHINHCLRKGEAERDQAFVEDVCSKIGVDLVVERHFVSQVAKERGLGVEEAARFVRRKALLRVADRLGIPLIATGHTLSDHVETMMVKLVQGTGLRGIMGMSPRQGPFVRPLLGVSKEEILDYAEKEGIPFVEDSSNQDTAYLRNWVRHRVMPVIRERNPSFLKVAKRLSEIAREHVELSEHLLNEAWEGLCSVEGGVVRLDVPGFLKLHPTIQRLVAMRFLKAAFPGRRMGREHVLQVCRLARTVKGVIGVPRGSVEKRGDWLIAHLVPVRELVSASYSCHPVEPYLIESLGVHQWGGQRWRVHLVKCPVEVGLEKGVALSSSKVSLPLLLRCRRAGDRIYRRGIGHKLVKKIMQEKGIPKEDRNRVPLLVDPSNNRVLWVAGLGADPRVAPSVGDAVLVIEREE